jgi:hypothetical protein
VKTKPIKMAFAENHRTNVFDLILSSEGLAWIGMKIFDQLAGKSLAKCESVCKIWRNFIINNGVQLWKRQYLQTLAQPGTEAYWLIKSNPKLFVFHQADQGRISILAD